MISKRTVYKFCIKDQIHLIENYELAINDKTQTWDCHHKREIDEDKSKQQLIDEGLYYDRPAEELIFLTKEEHIRLHNKGNQYFKGKHHSDEHKTKMSEAMQGNQNVKGKHWNLTEETKQKIIESKRGKPQKKHKWLTPEGEIREMSISHTKQYHPDWQLIGD